MQIAEACIVKASPWAPACRAGCMVVLYLKILKVLVFNTVKTKEPSVLIRAFKRAHKDVVERLSGVDFAPISPGEASATWERAEREILLETNRKHDWEHRKSPWFRLYYHFY
jgi:hypothetical protein